MRRRAAPDKIREQVTCHGVLRSELDRYVKVKIGTTARFDLFPNPFQAVYRAQRAFDAIPTPRPMLATMPNPSITPRQYGTLRPSTGCAPIQAYSGGCPATQQGNSCPNAWRQTKEIEYTVDVLTPGAGRHHRQHSGG